MKTVVIRTTHLVIIEDEGKRFSIENAFSGLGYTWNSAYSRARQRLYDYENNRYVVERSREEVLHWED